MPFLTQSQRAYGTGPIGNQGTVAQNTPGGQFSPIPGAASSFGGPGVFGENNMARASSPTSNPYDLGTQFAAYYNQMPTHQIVSGMQAGQAPTMSAVGAAAPPQSQTNAQYTPPPGNGPNPSLSTPAAAGSANAAMPGVMNGNPAIGVPSAEVSTAPSASAPSAPAPPKAPEYTPPPPSPTPQPASNFTTGGTTPMSQTAAYTDTTGDTREAALAAGPGGAAAQDIAPKNAQADAPGEFSFARTIFGANWFANHTAAEQRDILKANGWKKDANGVWQQNQGGIAGENGPEEEYIYVPPAGSDLPVGGGPAPVEGDEGGPTLTDEEKSGKWSLEGDVFNPNYDKAKLYPNLNTNEPGLTINGLDTSIITSIGLGNNHNYIASAKVRNTFLDAWRAATNISTFSSEGMTDPTKLAKAWDDFNTANNKLESVGIKFNPFTEGDGTGSSGDTTGEIDPIWNENTDEAALTTVPNVGGMFTKFKNMYGVGKGAGPEAAALAWEATQQWLNSQINNQNFARSILQGQKEIDVYKNDPSRATSEGIANDIAANPDPTDWDTIRNKTVADSDATFNANQDALAKSFSRRGVDAASGAGIAGELNRERANDVSSRLGDLSVDKSRALRQGQLEALDALGNTFSRYAGGEAAAYGQQANRFQGLRGDQYAGAGVANSRVNQEAMQLERDALSDQDDANEENTRLGYFSSIMSYFGSISGGGG